MTVTALPFGTIVRVTKDDDNKYVAVTSAGEIVTDQFENHQLRRAVNEMGALKFIETAGGGQWRNCPLSEFSESTTPPAGTNDHQVIRDFIRSSPALRPSTYKMSDEKWRFTVRSLIRGKNLMVTGPRGTGKTVLAFVMADALKRPLFNIPLGSTQDPRSVIIGNTHFRATSDDHIGGTFVALSYFARAIQTENAIVLLDELTRAHPDAWNLLMPVLDQKQRFLRIDEDPNTPTIPVAKGVTFIATANIGSQYTATRALDAALVDRFSIVEVEPLGLDEEKSLLRDMFGAGVEDSILTAIANIADATRKDAISENSEIGDGISTRTTIEIAELVYDGFTLKDALEVTAYPQYSDIGGAQSPRAHVRKTAQKYIPTDKNAAGAAGTPFDTTAKKFPWESAG